MIVNKSQVAAMLAGNKHWSKWVEPLQRVLPTYEINTPVRVAMFMAQCKHESLNFTVLAENLNYSEKGLNAVFSKYFKKAGVDAAAYARNPERIANLVYANRMGNGDTASGDGYRYRGRGIIQLTGYNNYSAFAESVGKSVDDVVAYLDTTEGALESACWFWGVNKLNEYADAQDIAGCTKRINGGHNGLEDRNHHFLDIKMRIFDAKDVKPALVVPVLLKLNANGPQVKQVQEWLGFKGEDVDGWFGLNTEQAVKAFQKKSKLTEDGIVGSRTYKALQKANMNG